MKNSETPDAARLFKEIPSTDAVLQTENARQIAAAAGADCAANLVREAINSVRQTILQKFSDGAAENFSREDLLNQAAENLRSLWRKEQRRRLQKVINATGVIIHTNLGRAPLSEKAARAVSEIASGYCNLEYDLETGKRGRRGSSAEKYVAELTGAEDALIVNNCAAAALLVLTVFASGGEAIVSRGELVEIGGDFRVPDVLEQSGAILKEVGTTNRTKLADYEKACGEKTRMIMRVHPSNYRIVGFTAMPDLRELVQLAHRRDLIFYEDAGSGAMLDLSVYGLTDEPIIQTSIKAGADVVTFSGDKLLGGAQSGLIVGKKFVVEKLRKHPLYRALRVDKLIYAALEATLESFRGEKAFEEIPVLRMLSAKSIEMKKRAENFAAKLREKLSENSALAFEIATGNSAIGGGAAPSVQPATALLALKHDNFSASALEENLRAANPPVVARIAEGNVLLDLRTVSEAEEMLLLQILSAL